MKRTYLFLLGLVLALALAGCSTSKTGQFHRPDPTNTLPPSEATSAAITQPTETEAMESATPAPAGESSNPVVKSTKEQIFSYLSELFNEAYSPYYDGLHYEMTGYEETTDGNSTTSTFLWTMYFLGKGLDVGTDEGVEQQVNVKLQATAAADEDGVLDLETISVLMDDSGKGAANYSLPVEELFPT